MKTLQTYLAKNITMIYFIENYTKCVHVYVGTKKKIRIQ